MTAIGGPVVAVLVAWATSSAGGGPEGELALANVALLLAGITVAAALLTWIGGLTTSVAAAFALNWFHTEPLRTFRVDSADDVTAVLLLAALGLAVSAMTAVRVRTATRAGRDVGAIDARRDVAASSTATCPVHELWHASIGATSPHFALVTARLQGGTPEPSLPVLSHRDWPDDPDDASVVLPATGTAVALRGAPRRWVLLQPVGGVGPLTVDRRAVTAFADTLALATEPDRA